MTVVHGCVHNTQKFLEAMPSLGNHKHSCAVCQLSLLLFMLPFDVQLFCKRLTENFD